MANDFVTIIEDWNFYRDGSALRKRFVDGRFFDSEVFKKSPISSISQAHRMPRIAAERLGYVLHENGKSKCPKTNKVLRKKSKRKSLTRRA